jgi:glutaredoxin-like YruB-family protein
MALVEIGSHKEMLQNLDLRGKSYVLLYKRGAEASDCSYQNLEEASAQDINILVADVNIVRDIHTEYSITTAPALLVFNEGVFEKSIKGCNDNSYYKSLFENALFSAKTKANGKPQKRVTVYSTPTCSWCTTLKNHLKHNGIKYSEIDVSKDQKAAEAMVRKSGQQGVPQMDINGTMVIGFDKVKINKLLGIQ